jgi:fatty-acyl-CoA synthase
LLTLRTVQDERCTALHGVPTMFIAMLDHPRFAGFDLSTLRTGIMAGATCPIEVMKRVIEQMHMREVTIAYGMTETSPVSFQAATDDPLERRVDRSGASSRIWRCKIVDIDGHGAARRAGRIAHARLLGDAGLLERSERTATCSMPTAGCTPATWPPFDPEGYCRIVGRSRTC